MVPCPWFPAVAEMCKENPKMDMGVHATLYAEWNNYRWGPVLGGKVGKGLMDENGYFHQWHQAVYDNASPEEVDEEVNSQIERALKAGIDVTHVDSHIGTIMYPLYIQSYIQAASNRLLPNMLPRLTAKGIDMLGMGEEEVAAYAPTMDMLENLGVPMVDGILAMPLEHGNDHIGEAKKLLAELPVGITHFILHPSIDTPELRAICPDWESRVANYNAFMSDELKNYIENEDLKLIGYLQIREAMRK